MEIEYNSTNPYNFTFALQRIIDTTMMFFSLVPNQPNTVHASPIIHRNSDIILSSVSSDARRESSETLSFQGLSTLVWVLVAFSLLVVSALVTYLTFKTEKKKNSRERPWISWMNNVFIYTADIVNNCVAGVIRPGLGRTLRSWWLLGVVFLLQFWVAGMKSDLLVDKSTFIDSLEDLFSRPELILIIPKNSKKYHTFDETDDDPRFKDYIKKNIRYVDDRNDEEWHTLLINGKVVMLGQEYKIHFRRRDMEIGYNSSNPYNFTFVLERDNEEYGYEILTDPFDSYLSPDWLLFGLLFQSLKNVRFHFAKQREIFRRLSNVTDISKISEKNQHDLTFRATQHGIIDTSQLIFSIQPHQTEIVHVSPITNRNSDVILSSVSSNARRESSETLAFQGLPSSIWVLVGFSLLVVSGLATYFSFRTEKKKNRRGRPFNSWMNNVCVYAADIVNNCVAGVVRSEPGRLLSSWWLLGVAFLMQFWVAGMKSDLLVDKSTFIDSLEDLFSRPELILIISNYYADDNIFGTFEDDPRFEDYEKKKNRYVDNKYDEEWETLLANGKGVILGQEISALDYFNFRVQKLKEANRKQYNGKKSYRERYSYMIFNKRLPRAIKDDIDYLSSRLFETAQTEPERREHKFRTRNFIFDSTDDSASTMSWSALSVALLSPVFRLWITGMSLAIFAFCIEYYRSRALKTNSRSSLSPSLDGNPDQSLTTDIPITRSL